MDLRYLTSDPFSEPSPLLAVPHFKGDVPGSAWRRADELLGGVPARARAAGDLSGEEEQQLLVWSPSEGEGPRRILIQGAGSPGDWSMEAARAWAARAVRTAERLSLGAVSLAIETPGGAGPDDIAQAVAEGAALAAWDFRELRTAGGYRSPPPALVTTVRLHAAGGEADHESMDRAVRVGEALADGENLARTLQFRPGNIATPTHLGEVAEGLGREVGLEVEVWGPEEIRAQEMHALLAVAQGSSQEPRFLILRHHGGGRNDPPLVLVGKGLTFDTGGVSIKPAAGMEEMKYDMSGGAAVLGAMKTIARLALPVNVVGLVPSTENHVSGSAVKPGDVIRTRAGRTVEVVNTDAEGRLILADALSYGDSLAPAAMVDCATLTGACVVALGHHASAVLGTSESLVSELRAMGDRSGERCWPLPLWEVYRKQLDTAAADLKNVGGRPAGTITASLFLREFVGRTPWAHLDIAGVAYGDGPLPYHRKGGYGVPTRLLAEWVRSRAG